MRSPLSGYVWEQDGRVVGNVSLIPSQIEAQRTFLIANVAVHPDFRGHGIGRSLTAAALDYAAQREMQSVWLQVHAHNQPARRIYEGLGFNTRAARTHWQSARGGVAALPPPAVAVGERLAQDWPQQSAWLEALYPPLLRWQLALNPQLWQPGGWGLLLRLLSFEFPRHWAARRGAELLGLLTWLDAPAGRPNLWLALPPEPEPQALPALLSVARRQLGLRRALVLDLPEGLGVETLPELGFQARHTMLLMERRLKVQPVGFSAL